MKPCRWGLHQSDVFPSLIHLSGGGHMCHYSSCWHIFFLFLLVVRSFIREVSHLLTYNLAQMFSAPLKRDLATTKVSFFELSILIDKIVKAAVYHFSRRCWVWISGKCCSLMIKLSELSIYWNMEEGFIVKHRVLVGTRQGKTVHVLSHHCKYLCVRVKTCTQC